MFLEQGVLGKTYQKHNKDWDTKTAKLITIVTAAQSKIIVLVFTFQKTGTCIRKIKWSPDVCKII